LACGGGGLVPLAGAQPPNVVMGGIIGTAFVIATGKSAQEAIAVAIPFAIFQTKSSRIALYQHRTASPSVQYNTLY